MNQTRTRTALILFLAVCLFFSGCEKSDLLPEQTEMLSPSVVVLSDWEVAFLDAVDQMTAADILSMGTTVPFMQMLLRKRGGSVISLEDPEKQKETAYIRRPYVIFQDGKAVNFEQPSYYYDFRSGNYKPTVKVNNVGESSFRIYYIDGDFSDSDRLVPYLFDSVSWDTVMSELSVENQEILWSSYTQTTAGELTEQVRALFPSVEGTCYLLRDSSDEALLSQLLAGTGFTLMQRRIIETAAGYIPQDAVRLIIPCEVSVVNGALHVVILFDEIYCTDPSYQVLDRMQVEAGEVNKVPSLSESNS